MSASLVGSEMCIRDSSAEQHGGSGGGGPPETPGHAANNANVCMRRQEAVSYTHLTLPTICSV
eukprot:12453356-Alexandrium_andersonii.AAC.1